MRPQELCNSLSRIRDDADNAVSDQVENNSVYGRLPLTQREVIWTDRTLRVVQRVASTTGTGLVIVRYHERMN